MSKLLLDESPIVVLPTLAEKIGLNESMILQQLHYWLEKSSNVQDGFTWVYNSYEDWQEQFPFWSISTIRRTITKLETKGLFITGKFNKLKIDNTKWYRINYDLLEDMSRPPVQNEQTECSEWTDELLNMNRPLPENTTEITTDKKEEEEPASAHENPFRFFEQNGFGTIGGYIQEKISSWCSDLNDELVVKAMKIAVERGAKSWSYVEKILINWAEKKITSVKEADALILAHQEQSSKSRTGARKPFARVRQEQLPEWFDEPLVPSPMIAHGAVDDKATAEKRKALEERMKKYRTQEE
ncbi:DnaD domain-containing protein [Bacillus infantis]|uniref:DnaD domain protein n=1 Tax=Bacillus infantis TaxID=324767 RepID=A0A5D4RIE6_9BACI|nr:DnaD domain protein [Bacillus infantis]TYS50111.1 DnaD domain protein [Bacillus infantis]